MRSLRQRLGVLGAVVMILAALAAPALAAAYYGNTESKVFHAASCRYANCKHCTKTFSTREAAVAAGCRPCKVCKP